MDTTTLAADLARVDRAQETARSQVPGGALGSFPLPAELHALRILASTVRAYLADPQEYG